MTHGSLFSGIGGFDLAAEWMGWENVFHCEWEDFRRKVLKHHFPKSISYGDITKTDFTIHRGTVDIITGGFPCQPYSQAGKRLGKEDDRHLWPEMLRAIREVQPSWVVGENVRGLINWNDGMVFDEVHADLEAEGYEVQPFLLPACSVNAPHRRDRIWFIGHSDHSRTRKPMRGKSNGKESDSNRTRGIVHAKPREEGCNGNVANPECKRGIQIHEKTDKFRTERKLFNSDVHKWESFPTTKPVICGRDDGIPRELDGITFSKWRNESIKAYGNAIVPQVAYQIFKAIKQYESETRQQTNKH